MLTTAIAPVDLKALEKTLKQSLDRELLLLLPIEVNCSLQKDKLIISLNHPQPKVPRPQRIFQIVEPILRQQQELKSYDIFISLQLSNQAKAYTQQQLSLQDIYHTSKDNLSQS